jgi:hypothetical protein
MWGAFYACDECGYEVDALETDLEMKHPRPLRETVFAASYQQDHGPYLEGSRICQVSGEAPGSPWAS